MDTPRQDRMARRRDEVARRRANVINDYFDPGSLEFKLEGQETTDGHKLLLEWLLGEAITAAQRKADPRIQTLLQRLQSWRQHVRRNKPSGWDGPVATLIGKINWPGLATGKTEGNAINIKVGLPQREPEQILTALDFQEKRAELVAELGKCFAHEGAHLWQLHKYDNDSHPWNRTAPKTLSTRLEDPGIELGYWPDPMKAVYNEFVGGGLNQMAANDQELQRLTKALHNVDYYRPATRDLRGREVVSHLIELAYHWNEPARFAEVFPLGAKLLDDVLKPFEFKLTGS